MARSLARFGVFFLAGGLILRLAGYASPAETVLLVLAGAVVGLAAFVLAGVALTRIWFRGLEGGGRTLLAFLYGSICILPLLGAGIAAVFVPAMNDVATLSAEPPVLHLPADSLRERAQLLGNPPGEAAMPQNLFPAQSALPLAQVEEAVRAQAREWGWRLVGVRGSPGNPPVHLQYVATTMLMGFRDDVAVELRPRAGGGTEVHMRSASRLGHSDFGANARRIRDFLQTLSQRLNTTGTIGGGEG